ncbi:MAG: family 16 glycosylhydrolase [Oscillospiraceae bacterium]|jgi:beta-glucanase (GH16 family)|nr:family 16 glycosylhydrolase [Oscillospiraceae bacterium]
METIVLIWHTFLTYLLIAINFFVGDVFGLPLVNSLYQTVTKEYLDENFELVWHDEFDYDNSWKQDASHPFWRTWDTNAPWEGGINLGEYPTISVANGYLTLSVLLDEEGNGTAGASINTNPSMNQKFGYFEIRAKLSRLYCGGSQFWFYRVGEESTAPGWNGVEGARDGCEIDVFETFNGYEYSYPEDVVIDGKSYHVADPTSTWQNSVSFGLHWDGYNEYKKSYSYDYSTNGDAYNSFHTYGFEWNADMYIVYVDGREAFRITDPNLIVQTDKYLILGNSTYGIKQPYFVDNTDYIVDYVRVYQYKDLI